MADDVRVYDREGQGSELTTVTPTVIDGCHVLIVEGELAEDSYVLEEALAACTDGLPVIVDLTSVAFISSQGLQVLLDGPSTNVSSIVAPPRQCSPRSRHRRGSEASEGVRRCRDSKGTDQRELT